MHPYSRIDTTVTWKKLRFILSDRSDFRMIDNLSIAVHVFARRIYTHICVHKWHQALQIDLSDYNMYTHLQIDWLSLISKFVLSILFNKKPSFFKIKHSRTLFLVEHYIIKTDIIRYCGWRESQMKSFTLQLIIMPFFFFFFFINVNSNNLNGSASAEKFFISLHWLNHSNLRQLRSRDNLSF